MPSRTALTLLAAFSLTLLPMSADDGHHGVPEKLGKVRFPVSCKPAVLKGFERGVALLHSFAYQDAAEAFRQVASADPQCAMAHWGVAASYYHQLWEPQLEAGDLEKGREAISRAQELGKNASAREQGWIQALAAYYSSADASPRARAQAYVTEMASLAKAHPRDVETQIFYALALLATASPADATHANQKQAADLLEPMRKRFPRHPGIVHYLIHAYDNQELARRGLGVAREYSRIAPSAPHALHMPSHTFTRLGLWDESVASNRAARAAAQQQGDVGEVLHSMDYLMYAYLQADRQSDAASLLRELREMKELRAQMFKIGYAAAAMPVRYVMERRQWPEASDLAVAEASRPEVAALTHWARGIALARQQDAPGARLELDRLEALQTRLQEAGNTYWSAQVGFQADELRAWIAHAEKDSAGAERWMRKAADGEDALEKLPVTPGPVIPAREQLGDLLLALDRPSEALQEFEKSLALAPGRRNSLAGALRAAQALKDEKRVARYGSALRGGR